MTYERTTRNAGWIWLITILLVLFGATTSGAQDATPPPATADQATPPAAPEKKPTFEVYGFAMLDIGHDFKQINPNWFDTMRVTRLPSFKDQFGEDHNTFAGVRQSRLG